MSDEVEKGGTACSDDEAHAVMSLMFAKGVGDAVRALRAYGDKRAADAIRQWCESNPPEAKK